MSTSRKSQFFHVLIVTFFVTVRSGFMNNECPSEKLNGCICSKSFFFDKNLYLVNCTDQGFTDTTMLRALPEHVEALIFTGNNIPTLPPNIFGEIDKFSMLKIIDMSNNKIRNIKGKTYHHVKTVETLILNHNDLVVSDDYDENFHHPRMFSNFLNLRELHLTNAFADNGDSDLAEDLHDIFSNSNLTRLFKLHLEQNEISYFKDPNLFCELPALRQLYLGNNYLSKINFNVKCLKLQYLDIEKNRITELSKSDFDALDALYLLNKPEPFTVDLMDNPLRCESVTGLYNWLMHTNVTIRFKEQLQCHTTKFGNKYIVNLKDLVEVKHDKLSKAIMVLLVVLVLVLVSLLSAYAYIHRDKIKTRISPILDVVSRKVQYTTIDSQIV